jgi:hypothetical protein
MLKKISAALIAVSMLAAPAMAASTTKTQTAPINTPAAPAAKQAKSTVLNANAKMGRHHHRHVRHHVAHKKMSAHGLNKVSIKHASPAIKRG